MSDSEERANEIRMGLCKPRVIGETYDELDAFIEDLHEKGPLKASERSVERRGDLPWAIYLWQQCKAVKEPNPEHSSHHGRCDLIRNHAGIDHALERGMDIPRWSTDWTG